MLSTTFATLYSRLTFWLYDAKQRTIATWYAASILSGLRDQRDLLIEENAGKTAQEMGLATAQTDTGLDDMVSLIHPRETGSNLYNVTVTVIWQVGGTERNIQLSTVIRKE